MPRKPQPPKSPVTDITTRRARPAGLGKPSKTQLAEREARAMDLLVAGASYQQIADALSMSRSGVIGLTRRVLERRAEEARWNTDEARIIALERAERLFNHAFVLATGMADVTVDQMLKAHGVAQGWLDRYMRLHGIETAPSLQITVEAGESREEMTRRVLADLAERSARVIDGETA